MDAPRTIVLVDDLRSFLDGRNAEVARTSTAGVELLNRYRDGHLDELWLDHDLGGDDTIWPMVEILEQAAFEKHPFDIGVINVHSANPVGAAKIAQVLRHWGYRVHVASGSTDVGYLDGPTVRLTESNDRAGRPSRSDGGMSVHSILGRPIVEMTS
ncbi:cyclic-phosphate processing receiver domain-containing protein [Micromonospora craterilacus]|uniref:cyclic-phosphate processing receiver domain-containing protein n=1 Tax=Micromonospora craterilacus TaxID=1655439 RepID=UPI003F6A15FD